MTEVQKSRQYLETGNGQIRTKRKTFLERKTD